MNYHNIEHKGTRCLETERLLLRPFAPGDAEAMYRNWASDPEVTKFLTWPCHASPEVSAAILEDWVAQYEKPDYYQWAIVPKPLGQPIGSIAVVGQDAKAGKATVGYCIGRAWWHQGYTSEALGRVIDYLMGEVNFNRVESWHDPRNPHSGAVMAKCGMTFEATLRQADWNNQGICDLSMYAILASDWCQCRDEQELAKHQNTQRPTAHGWYQPEARNGKTLILPEGRSDCGDRRN